jgi:hypothetical protein
VANGRVLFRGNPLGFEKDIGHIADVGFDAFFGNIEVTQADDILVVCGGLPTGGIAFDIIRLCRSFFKCKG